MSPVLSDYHVMRIKDFQEVANLGKTAAATLYKDVKEHFAVAKVLFAHYKMYFKLP